MKDFTREELAKMRTLAEAGVDCPPDVVLRLLDMASRAVRCGDVTTFDDNEYACEREPGHGGHHENYERITATTRSWPAAKALARSAGEAKDG